MTELVLSWQIIGGRWIPNKTMKVENTYEINEEEDETDE